MEAATSSSRTVRTKLSTPSTPALSVTYKYARTGGDVDCISNVQFGSVDMYGDIGVMVCAYGGRLKSEQS